MYFDLATCDLLEDLRLCSIKALADPILSLSLTPGLGLNGDGDVQLLLQPLHGRVVGGGSARAVVVRGGGDRGRRGEVGVAQVEHEHQREGALPIDETFLQEKGMLDSPNHRNKHHSWDQSELLLCT